MGGNTTNPFLDKLASNKTTFSMVVVILSCVFIMLKSDIGLNGFQVDSESLVVDPILAVINDFDYDHEHFHLGRLLSINGDNDYYRWLYTSILDTDPCLNKYDYAYEVYDSQIGLQGIVFCAITLLIKTKLVITIERWLCCFLSITTVALIAKQLHKHYCGLFAFAFWLTSLISPYFAGFSPNLYWVLFTFYVPTLLSLLCITNEKHRPILYFLYFLSVVIKCLCGFEYLSSILISGEIFLVIELITNKNKTKKTIICILFSGLCMLLGFFAVALYQSFLYGNNDLAEGLSYFVRHLVEKRTYGDPSSFPVSMYEETIQESMNASVWQVLGMYFGRLGYGSLMSIIYVLALIVIVIDKIIFKKDIKVQFSLLLLQMVSVLSWLILAKSHSYIHTHINFIIFDLGYTQSCLFCILKTLSNHIKIEFLGNDSSSLSKITCELRFIR